jgi:hypothetical protein
MTIFHRVRLLLQRVPGGYVEGTSRIADPMFPNDPVDTDGTELPRSITDIAHVAESLDLAIPDACMPGVVANLALLDTHADTLLDRSTAGG